MFFGPALATAAGCSVCAQMMENPPGTGEFHVVGFVVLSPSGKVISKCASLLEARSELSRIAAEIEMALEEIFQFEAQVEDEENGYGR
jgi:hypothetical protein